MKPKRKNSGEANRSAKLKETQVLAIRRSRGTLKAIAARFGVCHVTIHEIKTRKTWAYLA